MVLTGIPNIELGISTEVPVPLQELIRIPLLSDGDIVKSPKDVTVDPF